MRRLFSSWLKLLLNWYKEEEQEEKYEENWAIFRNVLAVLYDVCSVQLNSNLILVFD